MAVKVDYKIYPFAVTNDVASFQSEMDYLFQREEFEATFTQADNDNIRGKNTTDYDVYLKRFMQVSESQVRLSHHGSSFASLRCIVLF